MTQEQILLILEKAKGLYFSSTELCEICGVSRKAVTTALKQLLKFEEIKKKKVTAKEGQRLYNNGIKKGMFLYYIEG